MGMADQMTRSAQSWLPVQAAPVNRTPGSAALSGGSGIEASGWFDDIVSGIGTVADVVKTVAPVAGPVLGAFGI
jgi:hypothetical protein